MSYIKDYLWHIWLIGKLKKGTLPFYYSITEESDDKCKCVDLYEIEDSQQSLYKYSVFI